MTDAQVTGEMDSELRRRGAITVSFFALIWSLAGSSGFDSSAVRFSVLGLAVVITVVMVVLAIRVDDTLEERRLRSLPPNWMRNYNLVGFAQVAAILVVVFGLVRLDQASVIPAAVCLVVGAHFFPLVRIFDQPLYVWTGIGLCVVAVVGAFSLAVMDEEATRALVGCCAAVILWATAAHLTFRS